MATATSIKLDEELKKRVQHLAEARRRTPHWIMREAIAQYVEREEQREAFKQEALRAWFFETEPCVQLEPLKPPQSGE